MAVLFIAALVRVWLLRRHEDKLVKKLETQEKQVLTLQKDLTLTRQDSDKWRTEMQRQFDLFHSTSTQHIEAEKKRFDDLLNKSREREHQLQTGLDIAKQMCSELPATKARLMQMESMIGLDAGEGFSQEIPVALPGAKFGLSTLPDLDGTPTEALSEMPPVDVPAATENPAEEGREIQAQLRHLQQQNQQLQQALTASRLRSRLRPRSNVRGRNGRN